MNFEDQKRRIQSSLRLRSMRYLGRSQLFRAIARGLPTQSGEVTSDLFPRASVTRLVRDVRTEGLGVGLELPKTVVAEILAWESAQPRYAERNLALGFHEADRARAEALLGRQFPLASFVRTADCAAIARIRRDPLLAAVAQQYLGTKAKLISSTLWWSYPAQTTPETKSEHAQLFHYDLDDFGFLKFFFYLTDVDEDSGPHVYVRGTHRRKTAAHLLRMGRYSDADVLASYGQARVTPVLGPAGSGFAADTFGMHKGMPPRSGSRLVLQILYAHYFYGWEDDVPRGATPTMIDLGAPAK